MVLTVVEQRVTNVFHVKEPTVRSYSSATLSPRPGRGGVWTARQAHIQNEAQPQWNTLGAGLGASAGPGTDDTVLRVLEPAPARAALTNMSDYIQYLASPARMAFAVSGDQQIYDDVPQILGRRAFMVHNRQQSGEETVALRYHLGNETEIALEDYALDNNFAAEPAEAIAIAFVDPDATDSVLLVFWQTLAGDVYCKPVTAAQEPRENMSWPKEGQTSTRYPVARPALSYGSNELITTGGQAGVRTGWTGLAIEGGDLFFSSLQAVNLGNDRVLLLHLEASGAVQARIVTYSSTSGQVTASSPVQVASGASNLYQAVTADYGRDGGLRTNVAFSTRTGSTGEVHTLNCAGTPALSGSAAIGTDYSHVGWVADRLAVLTKAGYSAGGSAVGFGPSPVEILLLDPATMAVTATVDADTDCSIAQTGTIHGFADGRLFMFCGSYSNTEVAVGHTWEFLGSGIRLWHVAGDTVTLQDQIGQGDAENRCSSTCAARWGEDVVFVWGPTGETYATPPGDEAPMFNTWWVSGVLKEGNSDVQPYRMSDNWLIVTEPEKNGIWTTVPDVVTPTARPIESLYIRAIHINNAGVPDIAGEPARLYGTWSWYSAGCRIDDTHFIHMGRGTDVFETSANYDESYLATQVVEVNETTGDLTVVYDTRDVASLDDEIYTVYDLVQIGTTNRYLLLYSHATAFDFGLINGPTAADLRVRCIEIGTDYSITVLDEQIVTTDAAGGPFTERKPYDLNTLSETTYIATYIKDWIVNGFNEGHYSSHNGILVDGNGQMTVGPRVGAIDAPNFDNPPAYGLQGVWFHDGCGVGGRYVYPVGDFWPSEARYPDVPSPSNPNFLVPQQAPFALAVMTVDPTTAEIDIAYYPLRVDRTRIDEDWYDANEFFAPTGQPPSVYIPATQRIYQAQPDGGLFYFWETCQVHPGPRDSQVWLFQGPSPVPWILGFNADAMTMALYQLDDENQVAWFRSPDSWGEFALPYWVSYQNGSVPLSRRYIACVTTTNYYSRAAPQGYSAGFGSNLLRVWSSGAPRGAAEAGPQIVRVSSEGRTP